MDITSKRKYDRELLFITAHETIYTMKEEQSFMKQKGAETIQK